MCDLSFVSYRWSDERCGPLSSCFCFGVRLIYYINKTLTNIYAMHWVTHTIMSFSNQYNPNVPIYLFKESLSFDIPSRYIYLSNRFRQSPLGLSNELKLKNNICCFKSFLFFYWSGHGQCAIWCPFKMPLISTRQNQTFVFWSFCSSYIYKWHFKLYLATWLDLFFPIQ